MPNGEIVTKQRLRVGQAWFSAEALYVTAITALAVIGMSSWSLRPVLLIATLLALPCGLVAAFGLYALTALFNSLADGFSTNIVSHGVGGCTIAGRCWSRTSGTSVGAQGFWFNFSVVALFTIAALANVLLIRSEVRRRRGASQDPPDG